MTMFTEKTTSSAVNASPSLHLMPSLRFTVTDVKSAFHSGCPSASHGLSSPSKMLR